MASSARLFSLSALPSLGHIYHPHLKNCFWSMDYGRGTAKHTSSPVIWYHPRFLVAPFYENFKVLHFSEKTYPYTTKWRCASGLDDARTGELKEAYEVIAELLHESGISKEDAMAISIKAPVYTQELVDAVHELDELDLWSSWQAVSGGDGVEDDTFKNKTLRIARRKGDRGLVPFLESIGVKPSSTSHVSRYLSSEPLICLIEKIKIFKELFSPANFHGRTPSRLVRHMMMHLSISADDDLQQALSFFEKVDAQRGGLTVLDSGDYILARLIESFPKILLRSVDGHLKPIIDFLEAVDVPRRFVGLVLLCFPPAILYDVEMEIQPRIRSLKKAGIRAKDLGKMLVKYPWLLSKCIQENVNVVTEYFAAAKAPKKNVDCAITRCPQLLGCSPDTLKVMVSQMTGLGIKSKRFGHVIAFSPQLLLRRMREFMEVVSYMEELGFNNENIGRMLYRCPEIYASSVEPSLKRKVKFLIELGILNLRLQRVVQKYPEVLVMDIDQTLKPRLDYLKQVGFSKDNVAFMVVGFPPILGYSVEEVLKPKLEYLVNTMGRSVKETVTYPRYFSYSLEKKIKPRFKILQNRKIHCDLKIMLSKGDDEFAEEYLGVGRMLVPPITDL
eukprot:Gb_01512 [translate_table: standard]